MTAKPSRRLFLGGCAAASASPWLTPPLAVAGAALLTTPGVRAEAAPRANLAMHLAGKGDLAGAEALLRVAVAQPSATLQIRQNLALVVGLQGRLDEAEKLARQDLPPETVDNNLAWLRAATGQGSMTRSYDAMRASG